MSENQAQSPRSKIIIAAAVVMLAIIVVGIGVLLPQRVSNHRCRDVKDCAEASANWHGTVGNDLIPHWSHPTGGDLVVQDRLPPPAVKSDFAINMPDAVKAYKEGMRYLLGNGVPKNLDIAEQKFKEAAKLGLPHGHYGIACVIYQKGDHSRTLEALDELKYASDHHVVDAIATLAADYYTGYGTPDSRAKGWLLGAEAVDIASNPPSGTGDPEYTYSYTREEANQHVLEIMKSEMCAPWLWN